MWGERGKKTQTLYALMNKKRKEKIISLYAKPLGYKMKI
jgi:hypothetical protein